MTLWNPKITRVQPQPPITRAWPPIPVFATLHWHDDTPTNEVPATAINWTRDAVEIVWEFHNETRTDWIPATNVRRAHPRTARPTVSGTSTP